MVCIQEASPTSERLALDYSAMPGVAMRTLTRDELSNDPQLALRPSD